MSTAGIRTAGLSRRTVVAGGLLAALVGTAFAVVLLAIDEMRQAAGLARHSETVLAAANRLERLVIDIETGQRGFLLTGDERYLDPWNEARTGFPDQARALERLATARSAEQGRQAQRIAQSGASYIQEYSVPTVEATRRDRVSVLTTATTDGGKGRVDALRVEFDRFGAFEDKLAASRQARAGAAGDRATLAAAGGVTASILLVSLCTGYLTRTIIRPVRRAAAMAGRLAAGDFAARLPDTGPAEIGALERAFNTMGEALAATASANAQLHAEFRRVAEEQAALRRVATLVAQGAPPDEVFAAVSEEVGRLLDADFMQMTRYDPDGGATIVGLWAGFCTAVTAPVGSPVKLGGQNATTLVLQTGRPVRVDDYDAEAGSAPAAALAAGVRSSIGAPIIVEGRTWGVTIVCCTQEEPLPAGAEARLADFTELVATAIANAESQAQLTSSRARIVAAADQARSRIERDLHDGAQQRLVCLALGLRAAQAAIPPEAGELAAHLDDLAADANSALDELRELARGIHPAVLAKGGIRPALKTLARRSTIPVELDVAVDGRLPDQIEIAVYCVVSEALTNATKHANASIIHVQVDTNEDDHGPVLRVHIADNGRGGADPDAGSGLIGLKDRVEALGGQLTLHSKPGSGTSLSVRLPLPEAAAIS